MALVSIDGFDLEATYRIGDIAVAADVNEMQPYGAWGSVLFADRGPGTTITIAVRVQDSDEDDFYAALGSLRARYPLGGDHVYNVKISDQLYFFGRLVSRSEEVEEEARWAGTVELTFRSESSLYPTTRTSAVLIYNTPTPIRLKASCECWPEVRVPGSTGYVYISDRRQSVKIYVASTKEMSSNFPALYAGGSANYSYTRTYAPPRCIHFASPTGSAGNWHGLTWTFDPPVDWSALTDYDCLWICLLVPTEISQVRIMIRDTAGRLAQVDVQNRMVMGQWCWVPIMRREFVIANSSINFGSINRLYILAVIPDNQSYSFCIDGNIAWRPSAYIRRTTSYRAIIYPRHGNLLKSNGEYSYGGLTIVGHCALQPGGNVAAVSASGLDYTYLYYTPEAP